MTFQKTPYLRNQRNFPNDSIKTLSVENDRAYIDIATKVNERTIGIFPATAPALTGEQWYFSNLTQRTQQSLRQVYFFTTFAAITHGINFSQIYGFTRIFGAFTDGNKWYPLPYVHPTAANQVGVDITSTQIVFNAGAGAPVPTKGTIVLEWLSLS